jgi:hypothetical protein
MGWPQRNILDNRLQKILEKHSPLNTPSTTFLYPISPICDPKSTRPFPFPRPPLRPGPSILKTNRHPLTPCRLRYRQDVQFANDTRGWGYLPITARMGNYAPRSGTPHRILDRMLRRGRERVIRAAAKRADGKAPPRWSDEHFFNYKYEDPIGMVQLTDQEEAIVKHADVEHIMRQIRVRKEMGEDERYFMRRWLGKCGYITREKMDAKAKAKSEGRKEKESWRHSFEDRYCIQGIYVYPWRSITDSGLVVPSIGGPRPHTIKPTTTHPGASWWKHGHAAEGATPSNVSLLSRSGPLTPLHHKHIRLFLRRWLARSPIPSILIDHTANTARKPLHYIRKSPRKRTYSPVNNYINRERPAPRITPILRTTPRMMQAFLHICHHPDHQGTGERVCRNQCRWERYLGGGWEVHIMIVRMKQYLGMEDGSEPVAVGRSAHI